MEDWKKVIVSDEAKFNRYGSDGIRYIWKKKGQDFKEKDIQETVKFGGGGIMVWGCMGWERPGILCEVEGKMDAKQYVDILESALLESLEKFGVSPHEIYFQQDGDGKHTSNLAWNWCDAHGIDLLGPWPGQSSDLNPIEHLWYIIKCRLEQQEGRAKGVHELWDRVAEEWGKVTVEDCRRLIESMPRRLQEVIKKKGGHTSY